ncbi:hypothetical protein K503DRAFT_853302 [Rhizopogon vinicolor AM-OR11-026]|uniref:Uncharacterized protein n=1 Tax=Rhizopogon vinicolor AM-OR11-026 TaxID=1314800 RepID=A0A1B7NET8_9AGAM|nr:hypothetical protein K503DRAFT_853302 [Rhizopogon vinicolor AM-OR11-026]
MSMSAHSAISRINNNVSTIPQHVPELLIPVPSLPQQLTTPPGESCPSVILKRQAIRIPVPLQTSSHASPLDILATFQELDDFFSWMDFTYPEAEGGELDNVTVGSTAPQVVSCPRLVSPDVLGKMQQSPLQDHQSGHMHPCRPTTIRLPLRTGRVVAIPGISFQQVTFQIFQLVALKYGVNDSGRDSAEGKNIYLCFLCSARKDIYTHHTFAGELNRVRSSGSRGRDGHTAQKYHMFLDIIIQKWSM